MQIVFPKHDIVVTEAIREHVDRRVRFGLSRFGERVTRVSVVFRGGDDLQGDCTVSCHAEVSVAGLGIVSADDSDADAYLAADRAVERVARSVRRAIALLDEHRSFSRNP